MKNYDGTTEDILLVKAKGYYIVLYNVFVKRVCLHALFLYVICVMSILKACCMLFHVPTLNKYFRLKLT